MIATAILFAQHEKRRLRLAPMNSFHIPPAFWPIFLFLSRCLAAALAVTFAVILADIGSQLVPSSYAGATYVLIGATTWTLFYWLWRSILMRVGLMPE